VSEQQAAHAFRDRRSMLTPRGPQSRAQRFLLFHAMPLAEKILPVLGEVGDGTTMGRCREIL
jgi:hypothetical protein